MKNVTAFVWSELVKQYVQLVQDINNNNKVRKEKKKLPEGKKFREEND